MIVGMPCGKCVVCGKQAYVRICGKPYCNKHGRDNIHKAVEEQLAIMEGDEEE